MKRRVSFAAVLAAGLLAGCAMTGPGSLRVHEALLYGGTQERVVWVYGTLGGGASSSVRLGSQSVEESFMTPVQLYEKLCSLAADFNGTGRYGGGADLGPTVQAIAVNQKLAGEMNQIRAGLAALNRTDGAAFNTQLHALGLGLGIQYAALPAGGR